MADTQTLHPGEYLGVDEVAALLGQSPSAIYAARHRGQEPAALGVRIGRRIVWRRSDIDRWFDSTVSAQLEEMGGAVTTRTRGRPPIGRRRLFHKSPLNDFRVDGSGGLG